MLVPLLLVGSIVAAVLRRRHGRVEPQRWLRATAMSLACAYVGFFGLFVVGETLQEPGGPAALGLIASWLVPMVLLVAVVWRWPAVGVVVLSVLAAVAVAVGVWHAVDPQWWRAFEDERGPVRAIAVLAMSLPLAVLAWRRPVVGGVLLVVVGAVPGLLALLAGGGAARPLFVVSLPVVLVGALFLASQR